MYQDLTPAQQQVSDYLSSISERCWTAGWIMNLEYVTWDAVINGPRRFGHGSITAEDIQELLRLARAAGAWVMFDDETEETAVPLAQWPAVFDAAMGRNRELLDG